MLSDNSNSPWIIDDVALLRETAEKFFASEAVRQLDHWTQQRHVERGFWRKAGELGLLCASVPEQYGGGGGTILHDLVVIMEQARILDLGFGNSVHSGIVSHYLLAYGSEDQKRRWLPQMCSGEAIAAIAMTEPGAGSDLRGISTRAQLDGDEYVVNGAKTFITNGICADYVIVAAKTAAGRAGESISLLMCETADVTGFSRGRNLEKIGQHTSDTAELFFSDVRIPRANLIGAEGAGLPMLMKQLPQERLIIGAIAAVITEQAVRNTVDYTKKRNAFGSPLFDMQNTRFELAECATLAHVGRVFFDDCVERHSHGLLDTATASMAKYWLTDVQCQVIDRCLQLYGGYGYMRDYPIARMYADARAQRIYGGANEVMKEMIARAL